MRKVITAVLLIVAVVMLATAPGHASCSGTMTKCCTVPVRASKSPTGRTQR